MSHRAPGTLGIRLFLAACFHSCSLKVGWLVGYNFLARKTSRVGGISETVVCTVKYCTVDSIANVKLSILVRPMSHVERYGYYGGSP